MPDLADSDYDLVPVDQQPQFADQLAPPSALASQVQGFPQRAADLGMAALGPIGEAGMTVGDMLRTGHVDPRDIPQVVGGVMMGAAAPEAEEAAPLEAGAEAVAKGITAYHGSPYDFDKFDLSKIGTGEGAQAYGHGLYFAENPGTAQSYRDTLAAQKNIKIGQDALKNAPGVNTGATRQAYYTLMHTKGNIDDAIVDAGSAMNPEEVQSVLHQWKEQGVSADPGKMYQVSINADPEHFLDWDKPMSEQSPQVQAALAPIQQSAAKSFPNIKDNTDVTGHGLVNAYAQHRGGNQVAVTDALRQAGIPGIKYLDQGSRQVAADAKEIASYQSAIEDGTKYLATVTDPVEKLRATDALATMRKNLSDLQNKQYTSNYVVFDDNLIDIVKKYGMAGLIAGGGAHFATVPTNNKPDFGDQHFAKGGSVKSTKAQAHYHGGTKAKRCADCNMFEPPHGCSAVRGSISPHGVCDFFERKAASKAA